MARATVKSVYVVKDRDGNPIAEYPLYEALYAYSITVYKSDCRKAVIGDPTQCLIALGAKRDPQIQDAFIGSGKDAYVIFKKKGNKPAHALHFTIAAQAAKVRDYFDTNKGATTQIIKLNAPTAGRTLAHRSKLNKARAARIKDGTHVPKRREGTKQTRIIRLGVAHRPSASIKRNGDVTLGG